MNVPNRGVPIVRLFLFLFGVLPLGLYTAIAAPMGFVIGLIAIASGQNIRLGLLFTLWAAAGACGMTALACSVARFGRRDFVLKHWEAAGIIAGLGACLPFFFFRLFASWVYLFVGAAAISGIVVSVCGAKDG